MNERNKRIITILSIFTIIFTVMGGSLAYWNWSSTTRTGVAFTIDKDFSCSADGGQNLNSTNIQLQPTADCTNPNTAIQRTIKVTQNIKRTGLTINLDMWLTVNSLGTHLSNSENLMYAITNNPSSCTTGVISKGNFKGLTTGGKVNLLEDKSYTQTTTDTYYLYIWLDKEETNPNTMNQTFNFSLGGECTDSNEKPLNKTIMSLANTEGSGVYHETAEVDAWTPIPANESEWTRIEIIDDSEEKQLPPVFSPNEESDSWDIHIHMNECLGAGSCDYLTTSGSINLTPKESNYYKLDVSTSRVDLRPLINDSPIPVTKIQCQGDDFTISEGYIIPYEPDVHCSIDLGNLTSEDKISISASSTEADTGSGELKFYKLERNKQLNMGYRYEGKNVDNYIKFNDELWRIIGVEEGSTIGLESNKYYTKIIRNESFEEREYYGDYGLIEDFLNVTYYNRTDLKHEIDEGEWKVYVDYTDIGLTATSRNQIVKPKWYYVDAMISLISKEMYEREHYLVSTNWNRHIGLMSPSDYGLAGLQSACQEITLNSYNTCINNNWLYTGMDEWILSNLFYDDEDDMEYNLGISSSGNVTPFSTYKLNAYRPVVYLKPDIKITKGSGKTDAPYEISLD